MAVYRGQTNTLSQIQAMARMRITTPSEAVAFMRALAPLNEQVAAVLQRTSISTTLGQNKQIEQPAPEPTPEPAPVPEPDKPFQPEDFGEDEGYSEKSKEERVAQLKTAKKVKKEKEK